MGKCHQNCNVDDSMKNMFEKFQKSWENKQYYLLIDKIAIPHHNLLEWACAMEQTNKRIAETYVGNLRVSTIFVGFNMAMSPERPPDIFETIIFKNESNMIEFRYSTYEEAEVGHALAVKKAKNMLK